MELELLVAKCLAKEREDRYLPPGDRQVDLRTLGEKLRWAAPRSCGLAHMTGAVPAVGRTLTPAEALPPGAIIVQRNRQRLLLGVAAASLLGLSVLLGLFLTRTPEPLPTIAVSLETPDGAKPGPMSLSPDGKLLAVAMQGSLWLRSLDSDEWRELRGTEGATYSFWSPDGTQIGFFAGAKLQKIAVAGGPPQTIADAPDGRGGSWGADGTILFAPNPFSGFQRVAESGGDPTIVGPERDPWTGRFPQLLPDGKHFISLDSGVRVRSLDGKEDAQLSGISGSNVWFSPTTPGSTDGFLLFVRAGVLIAQPFDVESLELTGEPTALPAEVARVQNTNYFAFAASASGSLAYQGSADVVPQRAVWTDRTGKVVERTGLVAEDVGDLRLSPDGSRVASALMSAGGAGGVWVYDFERETQTRVAEGVGSSTVWSPDGEKLAFSLAGRAMILRSADGSGEPIELPPSSTSPQNLFVTDWSRDGRYILYRSQDAATDYNVSFLERKEAGGIDWEKE